MATVNVRLVSACPSGGHSVIRLTKDARTVDLSNIVREDFTDPISDQDLAGWFRVVAKLGGEGKTLNQIRTALQAGVNVTVTF